MGRRVIQRDYAKRRQDARRAGQVVETRPLNAMDYLQAVDGVSRVGALRLRDEEGRYQRAVEEGKRTPPPLIELGQLLAATRAVETNTETGADLAYLRGRATSRGGLRPKCPIVDDDGHLAIGKFSSVGDERSGPEATIDALMSVIAYFRISRDRATAILEKVEGAVATWREEARALGMTAHDLESFRDAFEHKERQVVQQKLK